MFATVNGFEFMRVFVAASLFWLPVLSTSVAAQQDCPEQVPFSTTGTIKNYFYFQEGWNMLVRDTKCSIIYMHGKGRIPSGCDKGHRFSVSGTIKFWGGTNHLLVDSITCQ
jgi:hypothetical protein